MIDEIHIGDTGTLIKLTVEENGEAMDLSTATGITFDFERPDGTVFSKTGSLYGGGTTGIVSYTSLASTFDMEGGWRVQARMTVGSSVFRTSIAKFNVYANLAA